MINNNDINDWEEVPVTEQDQVNDWEDAPISEPMNARERDIRPVGQRMDENFQTAQDFLAGSAQGSTMNFADEIGAGAQTLYDKLFGSNIDVDKQLADQGFSGDLTPDATSFYNKAQQEEQQRFKDIEQRSPTAYTLGQVQGAIATGMATPALGAIRGAKATQPISSLIKQQGWQAGGIEGGKRAGLMAAEASALGVLSGAGSSEANMSDNASQVATDAFEGGTLGFGTGLGISALTSAAGAGKVGLGQAGDELADMAKSNPYMRKLGVQFEFGKEGYNTGDMATKNKLLQEKVVSPVESYTKKILDTRNKLGQNVGSALQTAEDAGQQVDLSKALQQGFQDLGQIYERNPDIADVSRAKDVYQKLIMNPQELVAPTKAADLVDDIDKAITRLQNATVKDSAETAMLGNLINIRKNIKQSMYEQLEPYKKASDAFKQFNRVVPENILAGAKSMDELSGRFGDLDRSEQHGKLNTSLKNMFGRSTEQANSAENAQMGLARVSERMGENIPGFSGQEFKKTAERTGDIADALRGRISERADAGVQSTAKSILGGVAEGARGAGLSIANISGRAIGKISNPAAKMSKNVYAASNDELLGMGDSLANVPGIAHLAKALKEAINNNDEAKKRAALFTIMQNPAAREALYGEANKE